MRFRFLIPLALVLGLATTAATTLVNRPYAAGLTGETNCAKDDNNPYGLCRDMRPQGGFPLIHISDKLDGPNPGKLGPEDDIYPVSIAGNTAGYMALWLGLIGAISLVGGRRRETESEAAPEPSPDNADAATDPEPAAETPADAPAQTETSETAPPS